MHSFSPWNASLTAGESDPSGRRGRSLYRDPAAIKAVTVDIQVQRKRFPDAGTDKMRPVLQDIRITLDDTSGQETLTLRTPQQTIVLKDGERSVEITDANGNSIKMEAAGITINTSAKVTINGSTVEVSAGMVTVNAGMSRFSGVVQADTVITNSVVSASYTPGAGNIW